MPCNSSVKVGRHAAPVTFNIVQGKTWDHEIALDQAGVPLDLSAYTFRMDIRTPAALLKTLTVGDGFVLGTTVAANDTLIFAVPASETKAWAIGTYGYDLEYDDGSGTVSELFYGSVVVLREETTSG